MVDQLGDQMAVELEHQRADPMAFVWACSLVHQSVVEWALQKVDLLVFQKVDLVVL